MDYPIEFLCPAMGVDIVSFKLHRTKEEPMTGTLFLPDRKLIVPKVTIPPTDVDRKSFLHWLVKPCVGATELDAPEKIRVELPEEPVIFEWRYGTMVAQEIAAPVYCWLSDGTTWAGTVKFPKCPFNLLTNMAAEVTAKGTIHLLQKGEKPTK